MHPVAAHAFDPGAEHVNVIEQSMSRCLCLFAASPVVQCWFIWLLFFHMYCAGGEIVLGTLIDPDAAAIKEVLLPTLQAVFSPVKTKVLNSVLYSP